MLKVMDGFLCHEWATSWLTKSLIVAIVPPSSQLTTLYFQCMNDKSCLLLAWKLTCSMLIMAHSLRLRLVRFSPGVDQIPSELYFWLTFLFPSDWEHIQSQQNLSICMTGHRIRLILETDRITRALNAKAYEAEDKSAWLNLWTVLIVQISIWIIVNQKYRLLSPMTMTHHNSSDCYFTHSERLNTWQHPQCLIINDKWRSTSAAMLKFNM